MEDLGQLGPSSDEYRLLFSGQQCHRPLQEGSLDSDAQFRRWGPCSLLRRSVVARARRRLWETVQITQQNVCNTTTSGTHTAQQCSTAMVGIPSPKSSWLASSTLQVTSLPLFGKTSGLTSGAQALFSYSAPTSGGHSSELGLPFFFSPSATQMTFVIGIQPTWDWNSDPKVGNKFLVSVFVGARPSISKN